MDPSFARHWTLDPAVRFLNHGSFGACPRGVLEVQAELRQRIEREPVQFLVHQLEPLLDSVRAALGAFLGADADDLALVTNATSAVNTVLRSLDFAAGDELLTTDHEYNACRNALDYVAQRTGARVVVAPIPFPPASDDTWVSALQAQVTSRTRLALVDHVTSPTGLVAPLAAIVAALAARGVDTLVDGAHAPGMLDLDLNGLGAAYYAGNCHKWVCAPKGAAFLHVRRDRQAAIRPLTISHGANSPRSDRSRFRLEFDWLGTADPTALLCIPAALSTLEGLVPEGWPEIRARNHALVLAGRALLAEVLSQPSALPPEHMLGSLAALRLPTGSHGPPTSSLYTDPLQHTLFRDHGIEVPIVAWPALGGRFVRVSAQLYNDRSDYEHLAAALIHSLQT